MPRMKVVLLMLNLTVWTPRIKVVLLMLNLVKLSISNTTFILSIQAVKFSINNTTFILGIQAATQKIPKKHRMQTQNFSGAAAGAVPFFSFPMGTKKRALHCSQRLIFSLHGNTVCTSWWGISARSLWRGVTKPA